MVNLVTGKNVAFGNISLENKNKSLNVLSNESLQPGDIFQVQGKNPTNYLVLEAEPGQKIKVLNMSDRNLQEKQMQKFISPMLSEHRVIGHLDFEA